jgi:hypothetical protein
VHTTAEGLHRGGAVAGDVETVGVVAVLGRRAAVALL